jgi:Uncharacterized protein conserved in archaea
VVKFLIVVKSQNPMDREHGDKRGAEAQGLGADDVRMVFLGPGINALSRKSETSQIVSKAAEDLKKAGVKVLACQMAMANFNVTKEDLVHYDDLVKGAEVILDHANKGYQILTF